MKLSIALLAAPAVAFAPQAQQAASVKLEAHKEVAAATLAAGALLAPFAAFAGDIESGATIFAGNCAACVRPRPRRLLASGRVSTPSRGASAVAPPPRRSGRAPAARPTRPSPRRQTLKTPRRPRRAPGSTGRASPRGRARPRLDAWTRGGRKQAPTKPRRAAINRHGLHELHYATSRLTDGRGTQRLLVCLAVRLGVTTSMRRPYARCQ